MKVFTLTLCPLSSVLSFPCTWVPTSMEDIFFCNLLSILKDPQLSSVLDSEFQMSSTYVVPLFEHLYKSLIEIGPVVLEEELWCFVLKLCLNTFICIVQSELKAQVSFFWSSVVRLPSVCQCQFKPNLTQSILWRKVFKFVQMKGHTYFQGEKITK